MECMRKTQRHCDWWSGAAVEWSHCPFVGKTPFRAALDRPGDFRTQPSSREPPRRGSRVEREPGSRPKKPVAFFPRSCVGHVPIQYPYVLTYVMYRHAISVRWIILGLGRSTSNPEITSPLSSTCGGRGRDFNSVTASIRGMELLTVSPNPPRAAGLPSIDIIIMRHRAVPLRSNTIIRHGPSR